MALENTTQDNPCESDNTIQMHGIDFVENTFVDKPLNLKLQSKDSPGGFGKPITLRAAKKMIDDHFENFFERLEAAGADQKDKIEKESASMIFGKETLLRILAQKGCEAIRFIPCIDREGNSSLVLLGVNESGGDLVAVSKLGEPDANIFDYFFKMAQAPPDDEQRPKDGEPQTNEEPDDDGSGDEASGTDTFKSFAYLRQLSEQADDPTDSEKKKKDKKLAKSIYDAYPKGKKKD